jgi:hypothetical protein
MSDFTDLQDQAPEDGLDRRQMIKRAALVGGALVWATPVVQSIGGTAFATTGSPGGGGGQQALSEVTIVLRCGTEGNYTYSWAKYLAGGNGTPAECSLSVNVAESNGSNPDPVCAAGEVALAAQIPAGATLGSCATGSVDANGTLCVTVPAGCTLLGWTVHDGFGDGTGNHCAYASAADGFTQHGRQDGDGLTATGSGSGPFCFSKP